MANFGLTATSLVDIWTQAWSSASTSNFHKGMFSFLDRMVPFLSSWGLFFFFFPMDFLPPLNFVKCVM